jgi:hypothetical protein
MSWVEIIDEFEAQNKIDLRLSQQEKDYLNAGRKPNGDRLNLDVINDTSTYKKVSATEKTLLSGATASRNGTAGSIVLRSDDGKMQLENLDCYTLDIDNPGSASALSLHRNTNYFADINWYDDADSMAARLRLDLSDNIDFTTLGELVLNSIDKVKIQHNSVDCFTLDSSVINIYKNISASGQNLDINLIDTNAVSNQDGSLIIDSYNDVDIKSHGETFIKLDSSNNNISINRDISMNSEIDASGYRANGYLGQSQVFTYVSDIQYSNMGILQMKKRSFQVRNGIVTMVGQISNWIEVPTEKL